MSIASRTYRGIGVTLAVLAGIGLVISSMPLSFFSAPTSPPQNLPPDFPADFKFEIAKTPEARAKGLSGRSDVPHHYGLLFVFDEPARHGIWMHDMQVPIDILWLSEDGTVIDARNDVSPETFPEVFTPASPASYVLEMRAGEAARLGISLGSRIPLPSID